MYVLLNSFVLFLGIGNWGCAKVYGRGTLYMKWGQQNQRFGTMRLRGEKRKKRKEKKDKNVNNKY